MTPGVTDGRLGGAVAGLRPRHVRGATLAEIAARIDARVDPRIENTAATDVIATGLTMDSAAVRPGDVFAAVPGVASSSHGASYADRAAHAGALAVLTDPAGADRAADTGLPVLTVDAGPTGLRAVLGAAAAEVYGDPTRDLVLIGVTGTNGKTTTAYLIDAALSALGPSGLIGTVQTRIGDEAVGSVRTTPEAPDLQALFAVMRERGVTRATMEVSSHALAMHRVDGSRYAVAGFTNLSQDHLDFHRDMDDYFEAKARLFTAELADAAVVTVDDDAGRRLAERIAATDVPLWTVSVDPDADGSLVDWRVEDVRRTADGLGSSFTALGPDGDRVPVTIGIPGAFNVGNALLATAMLRRVGVEADVIGPALAAARVPGRMERFAAAGGPVVLVDYAHTPAAVETVLDTVRPDVTGRLVTVLGCGGDRDAGKRGPMGAAAARFSDRVLITDDNPRHEDPATIRAAALRGATDEAVLQAAAGRTVDVGELGDRALAIRTAIADAGPGDVVMVLGKGHETGQDVAGTVQHFDDAECVTAALAAVGDATASGTTGTAR